MVEKSDMDSRIKDKNGELAISFVPDDDTATRQLFRKATAQSSISHSDIANGECELSCPVSNGVDRSS